MNETRNERSYTEQNSKGVLAMDDMFNIATRKVNVWGIEGYDIPKSYVDPIKQQQDRENLLIKKGQKDKRKVLRRGNYLEDLEKQNKYIPGPNKYEIKSQFIDNKVKKPNSAPSKKETYIDKIFKEQKARPVPGVGRYDLEISQEQLKKENDELRKKKIKAADRPSYLNEFQSLSIQFPGPGNYNPRESIKKTKTNHVKPEQQITKDKENERKRAKSLLPDVGSYKPHPVDFTSFGKLLFEKEEEKKLITQRKNWGNEVRLVDLKKGKTPQKSAAPGPGTYPLIVNWQGKLEGLSKDGKKKSYIDSISKGLTKSIYY